MKVKQLTPDMLNPENKWVKSPRWRKRIEGCWVYLVMAFWALIHPEATDWVLYNSLKNQFIEKGE